MTNSRRIDDRKVAGRRRRLAIAVVAVTASIASIEWARSVAASIEQARAAVAVGSRTTEVTDGLERARPNTAPVFAEIAAEGSPALDFDAEQGYPEPSTEHPLDEQGSYPAGPPSAAQVLELMESGLIPADEEGAAILRDTLEVTEP